MTKFVSFVVLCVIVFGGLISLPFLYVYGTDEEMTCSVDFKERVNDEDSSKYLIFCDEEVVENVDSLFYWKWNSSDFYRDIKEGQTYTFRVYGWRIPFLSVYRNIIKIYNQKA